MSIEVDLKLDQPVEPGSVVRALVRVSASSPQTGDGIELTLSGRIGPTADNTASISSEQFFFEKRVLAAAILLGGKHEYSVRFAIPATAPPSGREGTMVIDYELRCRVDVPWWFDTVETRSVEVRPAPVARPPRRPATISTAERGGLFIEASLDDTSFAPGETVTGRFSLGNIKDRRLDGGTISLVAAYGQNGASHRSHSQTRFVSLMNVRDGGVIPFEIMISKDRMPTFDEPVASLAWYVVIAIDGEAVACMVPIQIRPFKGARTSQSSSPAPIGRERWREAWEEMGQRHGLALDDRDLLLEGLTPERLRISIEAAGAGLVGRLGWEGFGIDLSVARRTLLRRGKFDIADIAFGDRFAVNGREEVQIVAALTPALRAAMLVFEEAELGDDYAILASPTATARNAAELERFIKRVMAFAKEVVDAERRIPPPAPFGAAAPAWAELAALTGGRLHLGRLAILDARIEGERLHIQTELGESGKPVRTRITLALDPPISRPFNPKAEGVTPELAALAKAVIDAARAAVIKARRPQKADAPGRPPPRASVRAQAGKMTLIVGAALRNPAILREAIAHMAMLARHLHGDIARGPYR